MDMVYPDGSDGKESARNAGDLGSIPGLGRSPGEGSGYPLQYSGLEGYSPWGCKSWTQLSDFHYYPLQYSCLKNSMVRGAWRPIVHGVTKSQT